MVHAAWQDGCPDRRCSIENGGDNADMREGRHGSAAAADAVRSRSCELDKQMYTAHAYMHREGFGLSCEASALRGARLLRAPLHASSERLLPERPSEDEGRPVGDRGVTHVDEDPHLAHLVLDASCERVPEGGRILAARLGHRRRQLLQREA